jgi:hypothetical protein
MRFAQGLLASLPACGVAATLGLHADSGDGARPALRSSGVVLSCKDGGAVGPYRAPGWRAASVVSGPLTLPYAKQHAQPSGAVRPAREQLEEIIGDPSVNMTERRLARRALQHTRPGSYPLSEMFAQVAAGRQATLSVDPSQRASVSLIYSFRARNSAAAGAPGVYRVSDGDPSVTFRACNGYDTEFNGGVLVAGTRCVRIILASPHRPAHDLILGFGTSTCGHLATSAPRAAHHRQPQLLSREPGIAVACHQPNSIACDRVAIGVWLRRAACGVSASIAGRIVRLHPGGLGGSGPLYWEGYLQPAGLLSGPLRVVPDAGRYFWEGSHPKEVTVLITVRRRHSPPATVTQRLTLGAGWG